MIDGWNWDCSWLRREVERFLGDLEREEVRRDGGGRLFEGPCAALY